MATKTILANSSFVVEGNITSKKPIDYTALLVVVFDKDLRSEQLLAEAVPDAKGHYRAAYAVEKASIAEKGTADLLVRVMDKAGAVLGQSKILFNAGENAIIDIAIDPALYRGPSTLEYITRQITPLLYKLNPTELTEDEQNRDISFLTAELGISDALIESFAAAYKLNAKAQLDVAFYFGLLAQDVPSRAGLLSGINFKEQKLSSIYVYLQTELVWKAMLNLSLTEVETLIKTAGENNLIPIANSDQLKKWLEQWARYHKDGGNDGGGTVSLLSNILNITDLPADKKKVFIEAYREAETIGLDFWKKLPAGEKIKADEVAKIKAVYDLSAIMEHDVLAAAHVAATHHVRDEASLRKLAALNEQDWEHVLKSSKTTKHDTVHESKLLVKRFEKAFPTTSLVARLAKNGKKIAGTASLQKLHDAFPEAELHKINIPQFIQANQKHLRLAKEEAAPFAEDLMKIQRVFKIAPQYRATEVLLNNNIHSAATIYKMGEGNFASLLTEQAGVSKQEAAQMYKKAESTHALSIALAGDLHSLTTGALNVLPEGGVQLLTSSLMKEFPDLKSLFGSADICDCQHCRSVYSAAAYLVDVLEYLDKRRSTTSGQSVKAVLFKRRADIGDIELSCENTNTPMPFIDLVCEILENAVADENWVLAAGLEPELATSPISTTLKTAILNLPLQVTAEATVLPGRDVNEWIIRDAKHTYKINKTGGQLLVRNSYQTYLSAEELKAKPEYINQQAYATLKAAKFPFLLPFDLSWYSTNAYLKVLEVNRHNLMDAFKLPAGPSTLELAYEYLQLPVAVGAIVAGTDGGTINDYWGNITTINQVNTFLTKTGVSYTQLLQLLECKFINPGGAIAISIPSGTTGCDASIQTITALDNPALDRIHRFLRLWKTTGWQMWELDAVIMCKAMENGSLNQNFLIKLKQFVWLQQQLKLSVEELVIMLDGFTTAPLRESQVTEREPLYHHLFLDRALFQPLDAAFYPENIKQGTPVELPGITALLADHAPVLTGALKLTAGELTLLATNTGNQKLTINNLDFLFRYSRLARSLRLPIADLFTVIELQDDTLPLSFDNPQNPFISLDNLYRFCNTVSVLQAMPFPVSDYSYLFTHRIAATASAAIDKTIVTFLEAWRKAVQDIEKALAIDATGSSRDWVKAQLANLPAFDETTLNKFIKIVDQNGSPAITPAQTTDLTAWLNGIIPVTGAGGLIPKLDEVTPADDATRLEGKYQFIKTGLTTWLRATQRRAQLVPLTATAFNITEKAAAALLDTLEVNAGTKLLQEYYNDANIAGGLPITEVNFATLFKVSRLINKSALLINTLSLTQPQVQFILQRATATALPAFGSLPLIETPAWPFMQQLVNLEIFTRLNKKYPGSEDGNLITCLEQAFAPAGTAAAFHAAMSLLTGFDLKLYDSSAAYFGYTFPGDYQSLANLQRTDNAIEYLLLLKTGTAEVASLIKATLTASDALLAENVVKAQFERSTWLTRSNEVQSPIRQLKRNALAQYLINNPPAGETFNDTNDLFAYYLIDAEMGACEVTTRILQAGLSAQLFVQRCLMQLEAEVIADASEDRKWLQWKWMKNYRVWEANRKVFLYPENYLEPELRPDKSAFFKDFENDLMQNEVTYDNVETGFLTYLEKLDNVARLNVCGTYFDENTLTFHVFAHTYDEPRLYYYRKFVKDRYWTPWEKVTVDIQSDQLIPVVRNSRLYIYWPEFNEVNDEPSSSDLTPPSPPASGGYPAASTAKKYKEIRLAVSEFKNKKWSPKKLSKTKIDTRYMGVSGSVEKEDFVFVPIIDSLQSVLDFLYMFIGSDPKITEPLEDFLDSIDIRNRNVIVCLYESADPGSDTHTNNPWGLQHIKTFDLGSCHGTSEIADPFTSATSQSPLVPYFDRSGYLDGENREVTVATPDSLVFHQWGSLPLINHAPLINKTPGNFRTQFTLQLSLVDKFFYMLSVFVQKIYSSYGHYSFSDRQGLPYATSTFLPFFYEDRSRTFMVQPELLITYPDPDNNEKTKADELFYSDILSFINEFAANKKIPDELKKYTNRDIKYQFKPAMRFRNFYHPLVCFFMKQVYVSGLDGLLNREVQLVGDLSITDAALKDKVRNKYKEVKPFDFKKVYDPTVLVNPFQYPEEEVDFSGDGSYSQYNWELFFHGPLYVAGRLSSNQKFEDAMKWFHYIFDPTDASAYTSPQKFWITKPFFLRSSTAPNNEYLKQRIDQILGMIHNNDLSLLKQVDDWKDNPFQPHLIAQFRTVAYQKSVVMKYIDNLVAWGDQLFRQNTRESLGQAAQLYILAAEILGPRPKIIPNKNGKSPKSYNQLKPGLDGFSNAVVQLENVIPAVPDVPPGTPPPPAPPLPAIETFYFCLPANEKLLGYWDTIGLRLFNLRNCLTIDGEARSTPLFDPPIDPALLVKAVAAGVDLQDALSELSAPLPYYRFNAILQKAKEFNNEVKSLGAAMLGAMEKKDGEALALLRSTNEIKVLQAAISIKEYAIQDAKESLESLKQNRRNAQLKINYYGGQLYMNPLETAAINLSTASTVIHTIGSVADVLAGALALIPMFNGGASGFGGSPHVTVSYGSEQISKAAELGAKVMYQTSAIMDKVSGLMSTQGGYVRRKDEWDFQKRMAETDLQQINRQIAAAEIKIAMAEKELKNQELHIENATQTDEFMRSKFTNYELYSWMITQLSGVYFQGYKLALDMAKKAEKCYRYELAAENTSFIQPGYWDSLYKGLQSAEKLAFDLNKMDGSYMDQNKREHEMTKTISLSLLDPLALIELKETGKCELFIPESLFDLDCPGHYLRRIKSVSVSVPCVAGPYASVNCKLTLMAGMVRKNTVTTGGYFRDAMTEDARFSFSYGVVQSVVTSNAQHDTGLFESNMKDERYLPFEGQGAISRWKIELLQLEQGGKRIRNFDFNTVSDVLLQIRYTARYGGDPFRKTVNDAITGAMNAITEYAVTSRNKFYRAIPVKHEMATAWHRFFHPAAPTGDQELLLSLTKDHFPFLLQEKGLQVIDVDLYVRYKSGINAALYKFTFDLASVVAPAELGAGVDELGLKKYTKTGLNNALPAVNPLEYKLTAWKQNGVNHERFTETDVEDMVLVIHYQVL